MDKHRQLYRKDKQMTITDVEVPEAYRTDREAMLRVTALALNELDPRLTSRHRIIITGFVLTAQEILDDGTGRVKCENIREPFLAYASALAEQTEFDFDPDSWMNRNEHSSYFTANDIIVSNVLHTQAAVLALAVR